jgi:DNA-binding transcriptional MerR regulator
MMEDAVLRPRDLAQEADVSVQTVRDYERLGFIPPANRSPGGHRQYGERHHQAMRVARECIHAFGWTNALTIMAAIHHDAPDTAWATIDACHAALHGKRQRLDELAALLPLLGEQLPAAATRSTRRLRTIGEAAKVVGVRPSALRFWEQEGLIRPDRAPGNGFRQYDDRQLRRLRIVAELRDADYRFATIHSVLDELSAGRPDAMLATLEEQRRGLNARSRAFAEATAALWSYVHPANGAS